MNKQRRTKLQQIIDKLYELQEELDCIKQEEEESYENTQETNLANSDKATQMEEAISEMEYAYDGIDEIIENLENAKNC